jgi:hypothetical protein
LARTTFQSTSVLETFFLTTAIQKGLVSKERAYAGGFFSWILTVAVPDGSFRVISTVPVHPARISQD